MSGLMSPDETYYAEQEDGDLEEVPPGATAKGVHDGIDIKISEGEVVFPEDVMRWHGLKFFMEAREEAKEGLARMAAEGLIKRPEGTIAESELSEMGAEEGLMAPSYEDEDEEAEFSEGGVGEDGGDKGSTSGDYGNASTSNDGSKDSGGWDGGGISGFASPTTDAGKTSAGTAGDKEESYAEASNASFGFGYGPAPTVGNTSGFREGMNPEMGGSAQRGSQLDALNNAAAMNSGLAGTIGSYAGGRAGVAMDPATGMFGTTYSNSPAQALGSIVGMGLGVPGVGRAANYAANQVGLGRNELGVDKTNSGLEGAIASGVDGFGYGADNLNNNNGNDDFNAGITALQALMQRPY